MCMACGLADASGAWSFAGLDLEAGDAKAHARGLTTLKYALAAYGLSTEEAETTSGLRIVNDAEEFVLARNLDEVWQAVELLVGAPLDPLDPRFLGGGFRAD